LEEKILALLNINPEKGLEKLMKSYAGLVYIIVHNKLYSTCSKEDIEECVSTIFYEAYEKRNSIDLTKGSLKAFLAVLAKRRAIDLFRKKAKSIGKVISIEDYEGNVIAEGKLSSATEGVERETKELLIESIKSLGEPDNEIFIRKYYFGQSTKIISMLLGLKENTIDKKVSRGLVKLKGIFSGQSILEREDM